MKIIYAYVVGDILHEGHLLFLGNAKALGDKLIVGVLTDKAVMEEKPKPIIEFSKRLELIKAIKCVDCAVPQREYSPLKNIKMIKPDILVESESHIGKKYLGKLRQSFKGRIIIVPYLPETSSTKIKNKVIVTEKRLVFKKYMSKSLVWRAIGIVTLALVTYIYTQELIVAGLITIIHHLIFVFVYYFHEKLWLNIAFKGKKRIIAKAITYELILGNLILGYITWLITKQIKQVTSITLTYISLRVIGFYFFDKIWDKKKRKV